MFTFLTLWTAAGILAFFFFIWLALEGKLQPKESWTAINKSTGKYERFNRKRART